MPIACSAAARGWWGLHLRGQAVTVTVSVLTCSASGVTQWLLTLVRGLLCYLTEKVCHMWQRGKCFSAGTRYPRSSQVPVEHLGGVSSAQQQEEAKLRYCKIRLMIQLKAGYSVPHMGSGEKKIPFQQLQCPYPIVQFLGLF